MRQKEAVKAITESLKKDPLVKAVFLKGSMGRGEEDEHSDVDLYALVDDESSFLKNREHHLKEYKEILFYDDIFIIAPQIIAVYEDLLHVDLFTVTEETLIHKDYLKVLYDPENRMEKGEQHLRLSEQEFLDAVDDAAFFLLQYKKSAGRGNDLWSVKVLNDVAENTARILLHKYCPKRAQLGLKTIERSLSEENKKELKEIYEELTISRHSFSAQKIAQLLDSEFDWIVQRLPRANFTEAFLRRMIDETK
ncbi:nucleotidyltransferase domain-containing protein [Halobacillus sp. A1]|uniref:nucleotidyltransferase domain-containing protein n=1 Tax=Halobacillus sp. A1 TaxID=2880262 RepID=UPI0020A6A1D6|nr:nucleotidyltransferase domain-containing protein [Halobacillus sp. A1]MCP3030138.1 nucleotidyltransferase domain-containing protein [Halobacillus sp. A1]